MSRGAAAPLSQRRTKTKNNADTGNRSHNISRVFTSPARRNLIQGAHQKNMLSIDYKGQTYRVVRGSDLQRDGMYLEMWSAKHPEKQLCEVFYSDITHTMAFACLDPEEIPLEVLEEYLRQSRHLLTPTSK